MLIIGSFCTAAMCARPAIRIARNVSLSPYVLIVIKRIKGKYVTLFNPSRDEVRQFFCGAWQKQLTGGVLTPIEMIACSWIKLHPEYHAILTSNEALSHEFTPEQGQTNPFLHLSMHLSISEQISIDQPPGIKLVAEQLTRKLDSEHEAQHQIMECLGRALWESQRNGQALDAHAYIESIRKLL